MITKFKLFEDFPFDKNFNVGDVVICIDADECNDTLEFMNKYIVKKSLDSPITKYNMITLQDYNTNNDVGDWFKDRFIKEKELEDWEAQNNTIKYNL